MPVENRHDFNNCFCWMPPVVDGKYEMPVIDGTLEIPNSEYFLNSEFARKLRKEEEKRNTWVMFYEWDWKFNRMWEWPKRQAKWLSSFGGAISPQFSIYCDTPLSIQISSVYKNRWCGAYWQSLGIKVIPTVTWGDERTYEFCFDGLPKNSVVSVGNMGNNTYLLDYMTFVNGFNKMCEVLSPSCVLFYGKKMYNLVDVPIVYINEKFV